ncbi:MAG: AraC family transcriptional regulator [Eubacteriales bacterium]
MPEYINIESSAQFDAGTVHITVKNEVHHGKVWLHSHNFYEFVYVDKGFSLHSYNGKTTILTPGDLFAISPHDIHSYTNAYQTTIYNCLFDLYELEGLGSEVMSLPGIKWALDGSAELPLVKVGLSERHDLVLLLERMRWERYNKAQGWEVALKSQLIQFLLAFSRIAQNAKSTIPDAKGSYLGYIYKVLLFIEDNYKNSEITTADIAEYTGLSVDYVSKQFKNQLSMSPSEYMRKFRIAKSMELLKSTDLSVAEITEMTGFKDISLFSRVFKQTIGKSPLSFRKDK